MSVTVIGRSFLRIGKNAIGLRALAKFFFCRGFIFRIAVGMPLQCSLAVGRLNLITRRGALHDKHFVIITFADLRHGLVQFPVLWDVAAGAAATRTVAGLSTRQWKI